ncbi:MAG TPA: hypothetical protein VFC17_09235, partial [Candidatus Limnocylindrales bacterium]|nr:hypothetical protein [Candidatus Limnocylindrales bacterium]
MNKTIAALLTGLLCHFAAAGKPGPAPSSDFAVREIHYAARLADDEARFLLDIDAEATASGESSVKILEGDVAVLPAKLPDQLKIIREGNR